MCRYFFSATFTATLRPWRLVWRRLPPMISSLIWGTSCATALEALGPLLLSSVPLTFFGRSHVQGAFSSNPIDAGALRPAYKTVGQAEVSSWPLKNGIQYLINPGSVGQPRDGDWRAAFAV